MLLSIIRFSLLHYGSTSRYAEHPVIHIQTVLFSQVIELKKNMRAEQGASDFIDFLEDTGRGIFGGKLLPYVQLEGRGIMCDSEDEVIRSIYTKEKVRNEFFFVFENLLFFSDHGQHLSLSELYSGYEE